MPAPMITIRWRAGSCLDSVVAIAVIYQMQVSGVNAVACPRAASPCPGRSPTSCLSVSVIRAAATPRSHAGLGVRVRVILGSNPAGQTERVAPRPVQISACSLTRQENPHDDISPTTGEHRLHGVLPGAGS